MAFIRARIHRFLDNPPGRRFESWYWYRQRDTRTGTYHRVLMVGAGVLVLTAGVVMLVIPGPGWLTIFVGAGLLAGESLAMARFLDRLDLGARKRLRRARAYWRRAGAGRRAALVLVPVGVVGIAAFLLGRAVLS